MTLVHDKENNRYVLAVKDVFAKVDYELKEGVMYLIHSEVPEILRGQGVGKVLVEQTFKKLTEEGYKAVAVCSYVKIIAMRNNKWKEIISF